MECLWYCFSPVIQDELDAVKENWNTHYIRKSRHDAINGRPDSLFFLPEHHGAVDMLNQVPEEKIQYISTHIVEEIPTHELLEYFEYVRLSLGCPQPNKMLWNYFKTLSILQKTAVNAYFLYFHLCFVNKGIRCH